MPNKIYKCKLTEYKHYETKIQEDVEPKRLIKLLTELNSKRGRKLCLVGIDNRKWGGGKQCHRYGIIGGWKNRNFNETPTHIFDLEGDTISFEDNISQRYCYQFASVEEANEFWYRYVERSKYLKS
jgi:hypothetical protein